jgi:hypothetical protein
MQTSARDCTKLCSQLPPSLVLHYRDENRDTAMKLGRADIKFSVQMGPTEGFPPVTPNILITHLPLYSASRGHLTSYPFSCFVWYYSYQSTVLYWSVQTSDLNRVSTYTFIKLWLCLTYSNSVVVILQRVYLTLHLWPHWKEQPVRSVAYSVYSLFLTVDDDV